MKMSSNAATPSQSAPSKLAPPSSSGAPPPTGASSSTVGHLDHASSSNFVDADSVDIDLLPLIHSIIRTVEKDSQDLSQKNKDSLEAAQKVAELQRKLAHIREQVYKLPGVDTSPEEQLKQMEVLKQQLEMKKKIVDKYKDLNVKVSGLTGGNRL